MAVASVTKITAASSEGFDAAVREGLLSLATIWVSAPDKRHLGVSEHGC
jgi:hypothetical protein